MLHWALLGTVASEIRAALWRRARGPWLPQPRTHAFEALEPRWALAVRFAVIGDYGSRDRGEPGVAEMVNAWNPDFVVTTGDNAYGTSYELAVCPYYGQFVPACSGDPQNRFFPAYGDHEANWQFFGLPTWFYYDVVWGDVHIFVVENVPSIGTPQEPFQQDWLRDGLAASTTPFQFVTMHYPPYTSGSRYGSQPFAQWPYEQWGADAVFAGHEHIYERLLVGSIPYFVNGVGGAGLYSCGQPIPETQFCFSQQYGAMLVTVEPQQATFQFFIVDEEVPGGRLLDEYSMTAPTATTHVLGVTVGNSTHPDRDYDVPVGSGAQLATVPLSGIDQVSLTFNQAVDVQASDLVLETENHGVMSATSVVVGPGPIAGSHIATWTFAQAIDADVIELVLSDRVSGAGGRQLDGDWHNPISPDAPTGDVFPSGDGVAGGDFRFRWSVLTGDANRDATVNHSDLAVLASHLGMASAADWTHADFDANGRVDLGDLHFLRRWFGFSVSTGDAALAASPDRTARIRTVGLPVQRLSASPFRVLAVDRVLADANLTNTRESLSLSRRSVRRYAGHGHWPPQDLLPRNQSVLT